MMVSESCFALFELDGKILNLNAIDTNSPCCATVLFRNSVTIIVTYNSSPSHIIALHHHHNVHESRENKKPVQCSACQHYGLYDIIFCKILTFDRSWYNEAIIPELWSDMATSVFTKSIVYNYSSRCFIFLSHI